MNRVDKWGRHTVVGDGGSNFWVKLGRKKINGQMTLITRIVTEIFIANGCHKIMNEWTIEYDTSVKKLLFDVIKFCIKVIVNSNQFTYFICRLDYPVLSVFDFFTVFSYSVTLFINFQFQRIDCFSLR